MIKPVPIGKDHLNFIAEPWLIDLLVDDERVALSCSLMKQNSAGRWRKKSLLLTTSKLVLIDEDFNIKRETPLTKVKAITMKTKAKGGGKFDFIVHVDGQHDYFFYTKKR